MPRNESKSPRAHGATQPNVSTVTFRYRMKSQVLKVHGRRTEVDNRIRTAVEKHKKALDFWDLHTNKNVVVDLTKVETWSVK